MGRGMKSREDIHLAEINHAEGPWLGMNRACPTPSSRLWRLTVRRTLTPLSVVLMFAARHVGTLFAKTGS